MTNKPITRRNAVFAMTASHPECQQTPSQIERRKIKLQADIDIMNLEYDDDYPAWSLVELGGYYGVLTMLDTGAYNIDIACTNNKFNGFECEERRHAEKLYVDAMDKAIGFDRGPGGYQPLTLTGDNDRWIDFNDGMPDIAQVVIPITRKITVKQHDDGGWVAEFGDDDAYTCHCDGAYEAVEECKKLLTEAAENGRI